MSNFKSVEKLDLTGKRIVVAGGTQVSRYIAAILKHFLNLFFSYVIRALAQESLRSAPA